MLNAHLNVGKQQFFLTLWSVRLGRDQKVEGRCRSTDRPAQQPPLMNFHLLIGDASSPTFAPVKTEIKMYLSLIKRIHVPRFALWVCPCFTNHLWPRDLNSPRVKHQTAFGLTFDHPRGHGLVKISISSMDRVISATKWSDAIGVETNHGFDTGGRPEKHSNFNRPGCKTFVWPFPPSEDESRLHDEEITSQRVWCRWKIPNLTSSHACHSS